MPKKSSFLLLLVTCLMLQLPAQPVLVGIYNDANTGLANVIRWDAVTGGMSDSIETTQPGYVMGSSVFDAYNQNYYFDGSVEFCRVGFDPQAYDTLAGSAMDSNTEIDMANGQIFTARLSPLFDSSGNYLSTSFDFVRYDIGDSSVVVLGSFPSLAGFFMDVSCYNSNAGIYYFLALDTLNVTHIVSVPTRTPGFNPTMAPIPSADGNLFTLEYDNDNDALYTLAAIYAPFWNLQVLQIDPQTGGLTLEADFPQLVGYLMTTSTYDQASNSMLMVGIDTNQTYQLYRYFTQTQTLGTALFPYPGEFGELECDNALYAAAKYGTVTAIKEQDEKAALLLYPNPVQDRLHISANSEILELQLIDALGRVTALAPAANGNAIDLHVLPAGFYLLRAKLTDGSWEQGKFLKQ